MKHNILVPLFLFILLIISRMLSDIPNFTPTISLIIFAGFYIQDRVFAASVILFSQIISDAFIGFHDSMMFVYLPLLLIGYLSPIIIRKLNILSVSIASVLSPSIFFIISNFGVWLTMGLYPGNLSGLLSCYVAGIPFFKYSLLSTILFSLTIFICHRIIEKNIKKNTSSVSVRDNN
ncbi:MAG: DUF6580 family putative transport protein [Pseudomonadota bacterium]|nr:DUF6580 family putative transport protein [Pseudomonadota bacterium]